SVASTLQAEVGACVRGPTGSTTYGSLPVPPQVCGAVRVALRAPRGAFRAPPEVESAVPHLRVRPGPCVPLADERRFHAVVRAAFAQRRKTLANALAAGLGLPLEVVRKATTTAGVDPGRRAETLTILDFAGLAPRLVCGPW